MGNVVTLRIAWQHAMESAAPLPDVALCLACAMVVLIAVWHLDCLLSSANPRLRVFLWRSIVLSLLARRQTLLPRVLQFRQLKRRTVVLVSATTVSMLVVIGGARSVWAENSNTWTLPFPADADYGTVSTHDPPKMISGYLQLGKSNSRQPAQGDVQVRRDDFVSLNLNGRASHDLSVLRDLPAEVVNSLTISNCELDQRAFETIARFSGLRVLHFEDCSIASGVEIDSLPVLGELNVFQFRASMEDQVDDFVQWAASCPKLAFAWCRNQFFSAQHLAHFFGHPSASFLSINVGSDARELFGSLKNIPNLRALNVRVQEDAAPSYWRELPALNKLELFNWSGGLIDEELLTAMSQMESLRVLRLQGSSVFAASGPAGLKRLTRLEELTFRPDKILCSEDEIHSALQSMVRLANWPKLKRPSKATLRALASREARTRVSIDGLGEDATIDDVVAVLDTDTLTYLRLSGVPLTEEIATAIQRNTRLEYLSYSGAEFDGALFSQPERLSQLDYVSLWVRGRTAHLDVLSRLPALTGVQLGIHSMMPKNLSFLSRCPKLASLEVVAGYSDDSTARLIGESATLKSAQLGQDCFMTDAAVASLIQNRRLESLFVSGHISKQAALRLKELPRLSQLSLWSDSIAEPDREALKQEFGHLTSVDFREFYPSSGKYQVGGDGVWRVKLSEGDTAFSQLEGKHARVLFGDEVYAQVESIMRNKVILVDFWGTWCGPCLMLKPHLRDLSISHKPNGFEVISVHSKRGLEALAEYEKLHPSPWKNLRDEDGKLGESFGVRRYPSLYVFDRNGILRVARPHRLRLEHAITTYLDH